MKRTRYISLIIALLSVLSITAQQQQSQYALYNYRNDGDFNAWLNIDVDSITYSCIGIDSIEYDNIVTQEVWTPDSCYRIPLEVIDSIGFRAPAPIMREGLFYLRDYHAALTNSIDSLTIYFDKSILPDSLPSIGQVVLNASYTSPYEGGFAGRVKSIESNDTAVVVECEMIAVGDVYKRLVLVGKAISNSESGASSRRRAAGDAWIDFEDKNIKVIDDIGDFTFSCLNGILSVVSKDPTAVVSYYVYIDEFFYSMYAQLNLIHHDLQTHVNISLAKIESLNKETKDILKALTSVDNLDSWLEGKLNGAEDKKDEPGEIDLLNYLWKNHKLKNKVPIPIAGPLVLDYEFGPVLKLKGDLELDWAFKTTALNTFYVKASGYTAAVASNPQLALLTGLAKVEGSSSFSSDPISNQQIDFRAKGSLTAGISGKVTISLINKNVVHATVSAQGGLKTSGQLNLKLMDTSTDDADETIYEATKDTKFKTEFFAKAGVNFGATPAKLLSIGEEWEFYTKDLGTTYLFPHFTQPTLPTYDSKKDQWSNGNSNNHLVLESSPSKNIPDFLLGPCKIGMKIIDENGVCVKESDEREYRDDGTIVWGLFPLSIDLTGLTPGHTYRCFPVLHYHDWWQLRATPSYEFTIPDPLVASPSELTLAVGSTADVQYFGGWDTFAVVMEEGEDVASIVPDGEPRLIRVKGNKVGNASLKIEDRRTGQVVHVPITVTNDESSMICPDDNHPHFIDLGLPSGTKWSCCNVGANSPEEYGDYFQWGETTPVQDGEDCDWNSSYAPGGTPFTGTSYRDCCTDKDPMYVDGTIYQDTDGQWTCNISGNVKYDAATANWGGSWRMFTEEQLDELYQNCSFNIASRNGVSGYEVKSNINNNVIFFPAAGCRYGTETYRAGSFGSYWLPTLWGGTSRYPNGWYFGSEEDEWQDDLRCYGRTIRPVSIAAGDNLTPIGEKETITVNGVSFTMIPVEGGTFQIGSNDSDAYNDEQPVHQVTLSSFSIGQTEVTQELWEAVMGSNPSYFNGNKLPVERVSWNDCQTFIGKLNELTGKTFRLPTEAEWEYAARGGNKSNGYKYSGSNTIGDVAWYRDNSNSTTHEVATKGPNELGIYDMSGNVWEWCQDWYGDYSSGSQTNPIGPSSGSYRVTRGGSWSINARGCRVSVRYFSYPTDTLYILGLRLAL